MKNRSLALAAILAAFVIEAKAADVTYQPAYAPAPLAYDWSGLYAGAHLGFGEANYAGSLDTSSTTNPFENPGLLDMGGLLGGFQLGYNVQNDGFVWGIEGDISFTDFSDSFAAAAPDGGAPGPTTDTIYGNVDYLATIRGRAGVAHDDLLIYGTAGLAFADADFSMLDDATLVTGGLDFDDVGFVIGGGVERAIHGGPWTWRAEALYYTFDDRKSGATLTPDNDPGDFATFDDAWSVRFGVNYMFGHPSDG